MKEINSAILNIVEAVNNNPERALSAIEAARNVGYERSHFSKMFKEAGEITYSEYVIINKMICAAMDLRNTEMTIAAISEAYGYDNPGSFCRAFKRFCGYSPSEYRKNPTVVSLHFHKIICTDNGGIMIMKKLDPANVIGENFLKLLELPRVAIIMYCLLVSYAVAPSGMMLNYDPRGNSLPSIVIDRSVLEGNLFTAAEIVPSLVLLEDVGLVTIVKVEDEAFNVVVNPIPEELVSNGTLDAYVEFAKKMRES